LTQGGGVLDSGSIRRGSLKKPFSAYRGDDPYFFVCYAHDDATIVYPEDRNSNRDVQPVGRVSKQARCLLAS
jgi:hypothetical protein